MGIAFLISSSIFGEQYLGTAVPLVLPLFGVSTLGVGVFLGEFSTSLDLLWTSAESFGYSQRKDLSPTVNMA